MDLTVDSKFEDHPILGLEGDSDIIEALAKGLGFTKTLIESHTRRQDVVKARDLIAYILREYGDLSYPAIGRLLGGRDHTTIIHAYRKTRRKIEQSPKLKTELVDLIQEAELIKERKLHVEEQLIPEILSAVKADHEQDERKPIFREIPERNVRVLELWRGGLTLQNIANIFSLSRERVRQLVLATIRQGAMNESISKGIVMDSGVLVEEEFRERKKLKKQKEDIDTNIPAKEERWSRYYVACRQCGTTSMPHVTHGLCERCAGQYRGGRREDIIAHHSNKCDVCEISRGDAIRKHDRDFYITKSQQVLCRGCFLKITGKKLGHSIRRKRRRA